MLTVEIKVNGRMICHLYIVNRGNMNIEECLYSYELYNVGGATDYTGAEPNPNGETVCTGKVRHDRDEGAVALVRKVLESLRNKTERISPKEDPTVWDGAHPYKKIF